MCSNELEAASPAKFGLLVPSALPAARGKGFALQLSVLGLRGAA